MTWTRICVIAGIAARIACVLTGPGTVRTDAIAYRATARALAEGHLPGAWHWMPGWPLWMSLFFRAGLGERGVVAGSALLGIATIVLAGSLAHELGRDARLAAAIVAVMPSLATMPRLLVSENLALPIFVLAVLGLARAANRASWTHWAAFAAAAAAATYVREACLALALAGALVAVVKRSPSAALAIVIVIGAALAPWVLPHPYCALTTSDASAICIGLGDGATGGYRANVGAGCHVHLANIVTLAPAKLVRLFAFDDWTCDDFFAKRAAPRAMHALCNIPWWALLAGATVGATRKSAPVLVAVIVSVALVTIVTFGVGRFHAPLVPILAALCYRRRA
jgi:hypothetical protein